MTALIVFDFLRFNFFKVGKFATFRQRPKAKIVSAPGGLTFLTPWPGALPLDPAEGSALCIEELELGSGVRTWIFVVNFQAGLHTCIWRVSISLTPALML